MLSGFANEAIAMAGIGNRMLCGAGAFRQRKAAGDGPYLHDAWIHLSLYCTNNWTAPLISCAAAPLDLPVSMNQSPKFRVSFNTVGDNQSNN